VVEHEGGVAIEEVGHLGHGSDPLPLQVQDQEAVGLHGVEFGSELGVDVGVEVKAGASGDFPVEQVLVLVPRAQLVLAAHDLLEDPLPVDQLVQPCPERVAVGLDLALALAHVLGDLSVTVLAELLAALHEHVEVVLRPVPEPSPEQHLLLLSLYLVQLLLVVLFLQDGFESLPVLEELVVGGQHLPFFLQLLLLEDGLFLSPGARLVVYFDGELLVHGLEVLLAELGRDVENGDAGHAEAEVILFFFDLLLDSAVHLLGLVLAPGEEGVDVLV
jgi:hypothetical protein